MTVTDSPGGEIIGSLMGKGRNQFSTETEDDIQNRGTWEYHETSSREMIFHDSVSKSPFLRHPKKVSHACKSGAKP